MRELQRWLDAAPTLRRCTITFDGWKWDVTVSIVNPMDNTCKNGFSEGDSLTFAAVGAIMDLRSKET